MPSAPCSYRNKLATRRVLSLQVRFEEAVSDDTLLLFCTVGILLKAMQGNPALDGATHVIVDEVCIDRAIRAFLSF